ncbi:uncharacterized protein LOC118775453 [Megalops cyprinoides]|uniref:uncharacterized protein LOC118775453 n=1 Tax=Megalops cyprinoides TaxID=118141 RepID=UPI001864D805|nr:uncharacterized protein LOC118775453 [Megalops cyprinoides]
MAQMGGLLPSSAGEQPSDSRLLVTFLMSAIDSMCKDLAKSSVEVACVAVFNQEVFVVGTERGKGYAKIRSDFQREFVTYCVSEEERAKEHKRSKSSTSEHVSEKLNREKLIKAVEDLFSSCYGRALGKSSHMPVPYNLLQEDPSAVEVRGLPDGILLKEPRSYDMSTLKKILEKKSHISFVLRRDTFPVSGQRKLKAKSTSLAVKCENSSPDHFVTVRVKAESHENQEESEMAVTTVKEEQDGSHYALTSSHCDREAGEEEGKVFSVVASAACWSRAGIDLALGPGQHPPNLGFQPHFSSRNTQCSTKWGMTVLRKWYQGRFQRPASTIDLMSPRELDEILREFYLNAKTSKKDPYTKNSLNAIRKSINRYLRGPPLRRHINILCDSQFPASNRTYREVCSTLKMEGKASTKHMVPVAAEDLLKLYQSSALKTSSPQTLLNKVWFDIMFFLARDGGGGRYMQREFTRESFGFGIDEHGREFVYAVKDERSDLTRRMCQKMRMYALPGDPRCPVSAFQLYLSKLNPFSNALFQHPILHPSTDIWYNTKPVGVNVLGSMMPRLSKEAQLSFIYSNHSIRMTPIALLQGLLQPPSSKASSLTFKDQC